MPDSNGAYRRRREIVARDFELAAARRELSARIENYRERPEVVAARRELSETTSKLRSWLTAIGANPDLSGTTSKLSRLAENYRERP
jgi:hypothetical protein